MPKIQIIRKNISNKSCGELDFLQKIQWAHMSIFPTYAPIDFFLGNLIMDNFYLKHFIHIRGVFSSGQP